MILINYLDTLELFLFTSLRAQGGYIIIIKKPYYMIRINGTLNFLKNGFEQSDSFENKYTKHKKFPKQF